jgi:hypothetical protein
LPIFEIRAQIINIEDGIFKDFIDSNSQGEIFKISAPHIHLNKLGFVGIKLFTTSLLAVANVVGRNHS